MSDELGENTTPAGDALPYSPIDGGPPLERSGRAMQAGEVEIQRKLGIALMVGTVGVLLMFAAFSWLRLGQ